LLTCELSSCSRRRSHDHGNLHGRRGRPSVSAPWPGLQPRSEIPVDQVPPNRSTQQHRGRTRPSCLATSPPPEQLRRRPSRARRAAPSRLRDDQCSPAPPTQSQQGRPPRSLAAPAPRQPALRPTPFARRSSTLCRRCRHGPLCCTRGGPCASVPRRRRCESRPVGVGVEAVPVAHHHPHAVREMDTGQDHRGRQHGQGEACSEGRHRRAGKTNRLHASPVRRPVPNLVLGRSRARLSLGARSTTATTLEQTRSEQTNLRRFGRQERRPLSRS